MATRKVFGRQIPFPRATEPQCRACFNIGAKDHAPDKTCMAAEWSRREFTRKLNETTITTSPFGPCKTCDGTACVCACGTRESKHQGQDHDFDPTDCPVCTQREVSRPSAKDSL